MEPVKDLTFEDIAAADDLRVTPFDAPEWGGRVYCRVMSPTDRDAYERESLALAEASGDKKLGRMENFRARITRRTLCDARGNLLVKTAAQMAVLERKSGLVIDRFTDLAMELNEMTAEAVKRRAGKSETSPSGGPGSGSPSGSADPSPTSSAS